MPTYDLSPAALAVYQSAVVTPVDFAEFWHSMLAQAQAFPLDARFEPYDSGLDLFDVFDVTFAGFGGHPIRGWFILPTQRPKPLPLVVRFIGYGGGRGLPHEHLLWPSAGYAHFVMDTRGQGSGWATGDTPDPVGSDPAHPGFMTRGIVAKESYYYGRVFIDAVRAIEAAATYDGIDAKRIALYGGSQGGGIALAAAALSPLATAVMADVPFLSDFPRGVRMAQRDPYTEIVRFLSIHRDKTEQVFETLRYFDGVCFARTTKVPALFSVGGMDTVCPPSTVWAAFNAFAGEDKTMLEYPFNDHEGGGPFQQRAQLKWLKQRFS